jgi:hypothetical protein
LESKAVNNEKMLSIELTRRFGLAAAVISTVSGLLYLLGVTINLIVSGSTHSNSDTVQLISAFVAILWNLSLLILFYTQRWFIAEKRRFFMELAFIFVVLTCVTSNINWFARLTIVPAILQSGDKTLFALVDPYGSRSIMFAVEHLGWGLFLGLAALLAAFAFENKGLDGGIRWSLLAAGVLSLLHMFGIMLSNPVLSFLGYPAWAVFLPAATLMLAIQLRRSCC